MKRLLRTAALAALLVGSACLTVPRHTAYAEEAPPDEVPPEDADAGDPGEPTDPVEPTATQDIDDQSFSDTPGPDSDHPRTNLLAFTLDYENHSDVLVPGLLYSNSFKGLDLGLRYLKIDPDRGADIDGWSFALRKRLTGKRKSFSDDAPYGPGVSLVAGYSDLNPGGRFSSLGLVGTMPWPDHKPPKEKQLYASLSARLLAFDADAAGVDRTSTGAVGVGLNYYNKPIRHDWLWSLGARYEFSNSIFANDLWAFTYRCRPWVEREGWSEWERKRVQFSLTAGQDRGNGSFFGAGARVNLKWW